MTRDSDDDREDGSQETKRRDATAPKEKVLHTRVPAVLEGELKRLAESLRVPVSNVVRAILEDAVDAMDTVGERTETELIGFVDRLARHRDGLRSRLDRSKREPGETATDAHDEARDGTGRASEPECPTDFPAVLEGVIGYQPLVLATTTTCGVCRRELRAGSDAHRALFDDPTKRVFLGTRCRLVPEKGRT